MFKKILILAAAVAALPLGAARATVTNLNTTGAASTGTPYSFAVDLDSVPANISSLQGRITVVNASPSDVGSISFNGSAVQLSSSGSNLTGVVNLAGVTGTHLVFNAVFNNQKTYVVGFNIEDPSKSPAAVLSSTSYPIGVSGSSKVLGATTGLFVSDLRYGSRGTEVSALQQKLGALGYMKVGSTGFYGTVTRAAVRQFQKDHGLTVTGKVDASTRAVLNQM